MKRNAVSILTGVFFTAFLFINVYAGNKAELNKPAPDFTLTDSNGNKVSLSDYKGKWVVLEWINFGCPFVGKHYNSGHMQKLQKEYTEKNVIWLSICSSAQGKQGYMEMSEINPVLKEHNWSGTEYLVDADGRVGKMYEAKTTPHMYIITPDGILVYAGAIDDKPSTKLQDIKTANNYVSEMLDALLTGEEVPAKATVSYGCSVKYKD